MFYFFFERVSSETYSTGCLVSMILNYYFNKKKVVDICDSKSCLASKINRVCSLFHLLEESHAGKKIKTIHNFICHTIYCAKIIVCPRYI